MKICVIDRPDGADDPRIGQLEGRSRLQRILPSNLSEVSADTEVAFIRAGYWNEIDSLLDLAPALRWVHVNMAGVDHLMTDKLVASGVTLTSSQGVLDNAIAEFAVASALMWAKGLVRSAHDTRLRESNYRELLGNNELRALIIGAGGIGTACAAALRRAGVSSVAGVRRSSRRLDPTLFDETLAFGDLPTKVGDYSVIVAALPATSETEGMIDRTIFDALAQHAVFINVGRGVTADNVALANAMKARPESAAILDVTDPEPLPRDHPLWDCANVVISPHMSGDTANRHAEFTDLFLENLSRYESGLDLMNQVDLTVGYGAV